MFFEQQWVLSDKFSLESTSAAATPASYGPEERAIAAALFSHRRLMGQIREEGGGGGGGGEEGGIGGSSSAAAVMDYFPPASSSPPNAVAAMAILERHRLEDAVLALREADVRWRREALQLQLAEHQWQRQARRGTNQHQRQFLEGFGPQLPSPPEAIREETAREMRARQLAVEGLGGLRSGNADRIARGEGTATATATAPPTRNS